MNVKKCLQMLRDIKDVAFATVDKNGKPQVRIIDIMLAEKEKIYFCTARGKDFYYQLMNDNHIAVTGLSSNYQMIRLTGKAQKLSDQKYWINRIFDENPSMNDVYPKESRYILDAFCVSGGQVEYFDLGQKPIIREKFVLGKGKISETGFTISNSCIGCGICKKVCPQRCITEGKPYEINQQHCLHCGLCFEKCPKKAIVKRGVSDA